MQVILVCSSVSLVCVCAHVHVIVLRDFCSCTKAFDCLKVGSLDLLLFLNDRKNYTMNEMFCDGLCFQLLSYLNDGMEIKMKESYTKDTAAGN